jgi:cytochrome P450
MTGQFPPGPEGESWTTAFNADRLNYLWEANRTYGDLVHFWVGRKRHLYLVSHPDDVRYVLVEHNEKFGRGMLFKRRAGKLIGTGLLTSEGEFNKRQRRLMQPAFHRSQIASYAQIMVNDTLAIIKDWKPGETRDIHHEMMRLTMNIVAHALFGSDVSASTDEIGRAITKGIEYLNDEHLPEPTEAIQLLHSLSVRLIQTQRETGEARGDLLTLLMAAHDDEGTGGMTDDQLRDEIITLFIAGHETSANSLTWTWYLLSQYPDVEARLVDELRRVLDGRTPTLKDIPNLPYTDQVIKESLRMYPPAWNQTREVLEDVPLGGYIVPKGSIVMISPFIVQHNPRYFDDPECFDPDRFAEGNERRIPRGAYFPFSAGPRVCIGQPFAMLEMQLILATIAQRFKLTLTPGYDVQVEPFISLRPRGGLPMEIGERRST